MMILRRLGVLFHDSAAGGGGGCDACQTAYSVALFATCASNLILLPSVALEFDDWSEALSTSMSAVTCSTGTVTAMLSRLTVIRNAGRAARKYVTTLQGFEIYVPATDASLRSLRLFSLTAVAVCAAVVLPANCLEVYYINTRHRSPGLMSTYFAFYYFHNMSMWCTELHYAIQCFVVYTKFREVNDGLAAVAAAGTVAYAGDFYRPADGGHPVANVIELLKIKHWLTREAVVDLNSVFGVSIGLSMVSIAIASLFDVYTEVFYSNTDTALEAVFRSKILFVGWMLQYSFRFGLIVVTAHVATKQAIKTKSLITEMDNRYFDQSSKEELQLFHNQISICKTDFTICDIFTLNVNLITSALAAGATYILVLVQINRDKYTDEF